MRPTRLTRVVTLFAALAAPRAARAEPPATAARPAPEVVELSWLWRDPQPLWGALYLSYGQGRMGADLRGVDPAWYGTRPGLVAAPSGFTAFARLLPEGDETFRLTLMDQIGAGPMLDRNVDEQRLLAEYPATLPRELLGGQRSYWNYARAIVSGPIVPHKLFYFAEALDDRSAGTRLGSTVQEVTSDPRYTLNLAWYPSKVTKLTLGGRFDAQTTDNYGLSSLYFPSASRRREVEEISVVLHARHQLAPRVELGFTYDLTLARDDAPTAGGVGTSGHYNLATFQTWGNSPFTVRRHGEAHWVDLYASYFADGVLLPNDAHTLTLGAQLERMTRDEDETRNGGFSFTDEVPTDASGAPTTTLDPNDRSTWSLFSSDRGDELHAKLEHLAMAGYLKDRIRIGSAFQLTPGLRVESFSAGFAGGASPWSTLTAAPRLEAQWDLDGTTALWANAGRFYQNLSTSMYVRARQGAAYSPLEYWDWQGDPQQTPEPGLTDPSWQRARQFPALLGDLGAVKHPYMDRLSLGFNKAFEDLGLTGSVRYEYRTYGNMLAIEDVGGSYGQKTEVFGPGEDETITYPNLEPGSRQTYAIGNPASARRDAHSFNVSLRERPARPLEWLELRAAATIRTDRGNLDSLSGLSTEWQSPIGQMNSYGNMPGVTPLQLNLGVTVDVLRFRIYADYTYLAGQYHSRVFYVRPDNAPRQFAYDGRGRGAYQYPDRHVVDLRVSRDIVRFGGGVLSAWLQIYNLLNLGEPTSLREPATWFRGVRSLQAPREMYLGVRYDL